MVLGTIDKSWTVLLFALLIPWPTSGWVAPSPNLQTNARRMAALVRWNTRNDRNDCCTRKPATFARFHSSSSSTDLLGKEEVQRKQQQPKQPVATIIEPDYLVTNSYALQNRPSFRRFLMSTSQNFGGLAIVAIGLVLTLYNIVGTYNVSYVQCEVACIVLGILLALGDGRAVLQAQTICKYGLGDQTRFVSPNLRLGISDDAVIHAYAALYTMASAWLALRASPACPDALFAWDIAFGTTSTIIFLASLLIPILTLLHHHHLIDLESSLQGMVRFVRNQPDAPTTSTTTGDPSVAFQSSRLELSDTELLRVRGLLAIGIVGCIFAPDSLSFTLGGQLWWDRVTALHPSQSYLESSTALYGVLATQSSMIAHRAAKAGVATLDTIVPLFVAVCFVLAVVPCVCALFWLGGDVSFFSFYRD